MIYVLYGQPGSGKTTLGELLSECLDTPFVIDGDEFRDMFTNDYYINDFSQDKIIAEEIRANKLKEELDKQEVNNN